MTFEKSHEGRTPRRQPDTRAKPAETEPITAADVTLKPEEVTIARDDDPVVSDAELRDLDKTWASPGGIYGWFTHAEHKSIGRRFLITAFVFFALGGIEAALMRMQLARPESRLMGPDLYNQLFTMHGTTMMFLFAVPVMLALGIYFVPLMVGTRNIAFPRMVAFGYWIYLFGGIFLYVMFFLNVGPDNGWFAYVPLSGPDFGIGKRPDVWAQLITFTEVSALVVAIALIATIFKMRAPGMGLNRIPLFVWSIAIIAFMIVFAMPSVVIASTCLILDRLVGTHFFNQAEGGDPILWQHLFWFFAHPEVYIIFLPAQGMMSMLIATFSRRSVFGEQMLVLSMMATAFIGFGVWVHHMFTTGLPQLGQSFFTASSILITIPTGVQIFCWIATLWTGRIVLKTPMYYVLGFFAVFVIGGLTGVMLASVPLDSQVHDTFFVVAHLHYVLIGGSVFPLLGAIHYWFPKMTGRMMSESLGKVAFWGVFAGFNLVFFPQHVLGLMGMPRRVYTYPAETGWATLNLVGTVGAVVLALSLATYLVNVIVSLRRGLVAPSNPWDAPTLEWATTSPPPAYNFAPMPTVSAEDPLWHNKPSQPVIVGLAAACREVLITRVMDAEPDHRYELPKPSIWPFVTAVALAGLFVGSIFTPWAVVYGAVPVTAAMIAWFWPREGKSPAELERDIAAGRLRPHEETS